VGGNLEYFQVKLMLDSTDIIITATVLQAVPLDGDLVGMKTVVDCIQTET
jgi:hypothetical protein